MDKQTLNTYNKSASALAKKFTSIGPRVEDITKAFELNNRPAPKVLEIGCGDGRDALEITKRTSEYLGLDISKELIKFAQSKLPNSQFEVTDVLNFNPSHSYDIIFAFASLLHMNKNNIAKVLQMASDHLNQGGIFYISLKEDPYQKKVQTDDFGQRTFYYYEVKDLESMKPTDLKNSIYKSSNYRQYKVVYARLTKTKIERAPTKVGARSG